MSNGPARNIRCSWNISTSSGTSCVTFAKSTLDVPTSRQRCSWNIFRVTGSLLGHLWGTFGARLGHCWGTAGGGVGRGAGRAIGVGAGLRAEVGAGEGQEGGGRWPDRARCSSRVYVYPVDHQLTYKWQFGSLPNWFGSFRHRVVVCRKRRRASSRRSPARGPAARRRPRGRPRRSARGRRPCW